VKKTYRSEIYKQLDSGAWLTYSEAKEIIKKHILPEVAWRVATADRKSRVDEYHRKNKNAKYNPCWMDDEQLIRRGERIIAYRVLWNAICKEKKLIIVNGYLMRNI
jgi:hypothetical protein